MAAMARPQLLLLLLIAVLLAVVAFASADAPAPKADDDHVPSIVDPVAHSPVTDYVDIDDDADDLEDDEDAAPAGSPLGTTMRPPEKVSDTPSGSTSIVAGAGAISLAVVSVVAASSLAIGLVF